MARRYGRNQKRAAREQIAALTKTNDGLQRAVGDVISEISSYRRWSERLNRLVPSYSMLRKDVTVEHRSRDPGPEFDIANFARMNINQVRQFNTDQFVSDLERVRMNVMRIESQPDDFRQGLVIKMHVGSNGKNSVFYAVDNDYLRMNGIVDDDNALEWASANIAHELLNHADRINR